MLFGKKKKGQDEIQSTAPSSTEASPIVGDATIATEPKKEKRFSFLRLFTLLLSLSCLAFSVYCVALRIVQGNGNGENANSYLTLTGKSINDSKAIYSTFGQKNKKKINDYTFVGTKFFLSEYKITPSTLKNKTFSSDTTTTDFSLYDLTNDTVTALSNRTAFFSNKFFIDFSKVSVGDYLIYPYYGEEKSDKPDCYSLADESTVLTSVYTLPDTNGERKKITLKNNAASPFTLLTVKSCGSVIPDDYYDAVLFYQEYTDGKTATTISSESIDKLKSIQNSIYEENGYKIYVASSLQEAVNVNATVSLCVSSAQDEIMTSLFTETNYDSYNVSTLEDTELVGYDKVPEIRECVGYLDHGGEGYISVTGNSTVKKTTSRVGKESFLLHDEKKDIVDLLKQL